MHKNTDQRVSECVGLASSPVIIKVKPVSFDPTKVLNIVEKLLELVNVRVEE